jgi:hypothetical protein
VPSETLSPTVSLEWTATITPSPTPSATGTPELPAWTLERICSVPEPLLEDESIGEGTILYANEKGVFVTQGSLAESKMASYAEDPTLHVSPDRQHLVVTRFDHVPPLVVVMNLDGSSVLELPWPDSYPEIPSYGVTWFTMEWLRELGDDGWITFSATTGESGNVVKSPDFPWWYWNSDLARAVYADHDGSLYLVEIPEERLIRMLGKTSNMYFGPAWSSSGEQFIFPGDTQPASSVEEMYLYNAAGEGGQLTDFGTFLQTFLIGFLEWSPNDRYIAGWGRMEELDGPNGYDEIPRFLLLDMYERTLTDYCIEFGSMILGVADIRSFVWSHDSRYLAITTWENRPVLVLDVETGKSRALPNGTFIWGWAP